jgi:peptidyl-prolyl cis-trans isomerase C
MKTRFLLIAIAAALSLGACAKNEPPAKAADDYIAKVNGKPISKQAFETYATMVARRPVGELTPEQRTQVIDTLIAMQLAADTAEKSGTAKKSDVEIQLGLQRMNILSDALFKKYLEDHPITDAELRAEYESQIAASGGEYRARHILVESRATADGLLAQLNKGADFARLAEKNSVDGSAKQGGDLGWFNLKNMVPQFSAAVAKLEKGKITAEPVQTQFGWHIIKLEDTRAANPPPFDEVKEQVKGLLQRKKIQAYIEDLKKAAKIEKAETAAAATPTPGPTTAPVTPAENK